MLAQSLLLNQKLCEGAYRSKRLLKIMRRSISKGGQLRVRSGQLLCVFLLLYLSRFPFGNVSII
jgi:hypothetical protein